MYNRNYDIDMEVVKSFLEEAVNRVKTQENPEVLDDIKKTFKKTVPFSLRMYVASYLVKEAQRHYRGPRSNRRDFRERNPRFQSSSRDFNSRDFRENREHRAYNPESGVMEERIPRPRIQIDPSVAATIFISIGRNRRVFPRDLVGLLIGVAGIERDRIGDIRVLANYSFIQLFSEDAEKAIKALDGYDYRGRKLAVSYSRMKDEDLQENPAEQESQVQAEYDQQTAEDAAAYAAAEKAAANQEPFSAPNLSSEN